MQDPWKDYKDDPLTPEELQRTRHFVSTTGGQVEALWFLWGWLAMAVKDAKSWAAAMGVGALLWGPQIVEAVRKLMGVAQ
jgi:hypothetical protein